MADVKICWYAICSGAQEGLRATQTARQSFQASIHAPNEWILLLVVEGCIEKLSPSGLIQLIMTGSGAPMFQTWLWAEWW